MTQTVYHNIRRLLGFWLLPIMLLFGMAFLLYDLDRQRYMRAKRTIINENFYRIFPLPEGLDARALDMLHNSTPERREAAKTDLSEKLRDVVHGPLAIYKAMVLDEDGKVVLDFENTKKHREVNSWHNNLLLRTFWGSSELRMRSPILDEEGRPKTVRVQLYYTTPPDYTPIEDLTREYRLYVLLIVLAFLAAYIVLDRSLVRPLRRVGDKLQQTEEGTISLIDRPRTNLEYGFNLMAGQALAQEVRNRLGLVSQPDMNTRLESLADALRTIIDALPVREMCVMHAVENASVLVQAVPEFADNAEREAAIEQMTQTAENTDAPQFQIAPDEERCVFTERLEEQTIVVHMLLNPGAYHRHGGENLAQTLWRVCRSVAQGMVAQQQAGARLYRQRSEANITLSHNLGHDLTNIIATSKLDLMAITKLTQNFASLSEPKRKMLLDAVAGLSQSTQFLQEIVNIYRSFSQIRKPAYERNNVNELVAEFLDAYTPTVTGRIRFIRELNAQPDSLIVEPRLLKLALFNLLTNASQALRRQTDEAGLSPANQTITVRTRVMNDTGLFAIEVQDNGLGIRNMSGAPMPAAELSRIFDYGYTTRGDGGGEGMGLDWVRTIAVKFHAGTAEAENPPEGGALLRITMHSMETGEAQIPQS